ncbi:VOC family protein [Rhodococcoides corynebacterioides]|uniref:VOC family protein n=1 Tax=Rhodococcoides corynebacterioides TaxID=53972 RepID=A0ABS7NZX4_9NOCA|nr:VOC family protein [Rhodococcus corynebacterioides]MBY6365704.1 VOC family protein [Rhodococcus corynebacterioides]MBY6406435.1 VOC family protein [Rhodococcus corynebacterioides]
MSNSTNDTTANDTNPGFSTWPALRYRDARAAIAFLTDVLGFEAVAVYGEGDRVDHAELRWIGSGGTPGGVMLGSVREDSTIAGLPAGVGAVYLAVDEEAIGALFDRARQSAGRVVEALCEEDHGGRGFTVLDPEGVHWSVGTYAGHVG